MFEAEKKKQVATSQSTSGTEVSKKQREELKKRRGGFQKFTLRRRGVKPRGKKQPHLDKCMPIEMNDIWEKSKREFTFHYDILHKQPTNPDRDEAFLEFLLRFYTDNVQEQSYLFDKNNYQLMAPGPIKYPAPRFKISLMNELMITQEVAEYAKYLGLTGNDSESIQKRDAFKRIYFAVFEIEALVDEIDAEED